MKDYYQIMGLAPDATLQEIRARYRTLVRIYHPDRIKRSGDKEYAENLLKDINEAYQILSDPHSRERYDRSRARGEQGPGKDASTTADGSDESSEARADGFWCLPQVAYFGWVPAGALRTLQVMVGCGRGPSSDLQCWSVDPWVAVRVDARLPGDKSDAASVTVGVKTAGLSPGCHRGQVRLALNGERLVLPVVVLVSAQENVAKDWGAKEQARAPRRDSGARYIRRVLLGLAITGCLYACQFCSQSCGTASSPARTYPTRAVSSATKTPRPTPTKTPRPTPTLPVSSCVSVREWDEAWSAFDTGDYETAVTQYSRILSQAVTDEEKVLAHLVRGYAFLSTEQYGRSIEDFTSVIEIGRDVEDLQLAYSGRAMVYMSIEDYDQVVRDLTYAIRYGEDPDHYYGRAVANLWRGDLESAWDDAWACHRLAEDDETRAQASDLIADLTSMRARQ